MRSFHLFGNTPVRLLCARPNTLSVPSELVPPEFAFLLPVDGHANANPYNYRNPR
jgi:hypothetical protein